LARQNREVLLLVPEQFSFEAEREYWMKLGPALSEKVQVLSFDRLGEEIARLYGGLAGEWADDTVKLLLMREALKSCRPALNLYGKSAGRPDFVSEMLQTAEELKRAAVTPAMLEETAAACESGSLQDKLSDLALVLESYDALLARSFLDPSDRLERAAEKIAEYRYFAGRQLYLDGFKSFTARQMEIIRLALRDGEVTVTLCMTQEPTIGLFDGVQETGRRLRALAARENCPVAPTQWMEKPRRFASAAICHYTSQVLRPVPEPFGGVNDGVFCAALPNSFDEAEYVAAQICQLTRQGYRYSDMAVIGRDMDQRAAALEAAFDRYGIPWFHDGGETADTMPLIRFVRRYCAMTAGDLPREEVLAFFKCGLLNLTTEEIAAFEEYTYVWGVTGAQLRQPFCQDPRGFTSAPMGLREQELLEWAEKLRQLAVSAADSLRSGIRERGSLPEALWDALCGLGVPGQVEERIRLLLEGGRETDAENERRAWEALGGFLDAAARISSLRRSEGESEMTLREFRELLTLSACSCRLASRPQTLDSVLMGSAERVRTGEKKVLFAVGAEEQVFPLVPGQGGVFTDRERKALREEGLWLDNLSEQRLADERFVAWQTVSIPSERLYLSYAMGDVAGKLQAPSELITGFRGIFPGSPVRARQQMDPLDFCQSLSTGFLQYARCREGNGDGFSASLRAVLTEDPLYAPRVQRLEEASRLGRLLLEDSSLSRKLFMGRTELSERSYALIRLEPGLRFLVTGRQPGSHPLQLSPSQIERFYSCPFAYFCRYGLKLKPRTKADLTPLSRGNAIHWLLERMLREPDFLTMPEQRLEQLTERHLAEYLLSVMGGRADKSSRFLYYYDRLRETLLKILRVLQAELSQTEFRVAGLEESIARGGAVQPLRIETEAGPVEVGGKIDRVDWAELDGVRYVRVVDYKSGKKEFKLEEVHQGLNLQMLLYLFAVWQSSGKYRDVQPAGILYMPAHPAEPKLNRGQQGDPLSGYRMSGLLLSNDRVLEAMEPGLGGRFLPVYQTKNSLSGKVMQSAEEIAALRQEAEELVCRMTRELLSGHVAPAPQKSGDRDPCKWCDYRAVCGRETDS
ncbi:MAG: PD-(D/E)XK nuclease family protein, partial [Oscillospiraceae bacterium]|nr:PD-(D/E)XK nuclease family protein [Oscillospiraceae bacterium]